MSAFSLIIFDCDGVLVDSERLANRVFADILQQECDLHFDLAGMFSTFVGRSSEQCMEIVEQMTGQPVPDNLVRRYREDINMALAREVEAVKGIKSVLSELTVPYCVASSGSYEKMQMTLGKTGLLPYFEGRLFSTSEVARGKPHGDIYWHAASKMGGINPTECLVIEDSPTGVAGGIAAGMTVFGYCELMDRQRLRKAGAHHTFDDMAKLMSAVANFSR